MEKYLYITFLFQNPDTFVFVIGVSIKTWNYAERLRYTSILQKANYSRENCLHLNVSVLRDNTTRDKVISGIWLHDPNMMNLWRKTS